MVSKISARNSLTLANKISTRVFNIEQLAVTQISNMRRLTTRLSTDGPRNLGGWNHVSQIALRCTSRANGIFYQLYQKSVVVAVDQTDLPG